MCGIFALQYNIQQHNLDQIIASFQMLANRGPDTNSLHKYDKVILGFHRLAIMDTSPNGNQPFSFKTSKVICNGEIYNHQFLKDIHELSCKSTSDCECLLPLFHKIGFTNLVQVLNGDFAFIIYHDNKFYFARDRIGVRPLFYGITNDDNFVLASYARALAGYCKEVYPVPPGSGIYDFDSRELKLEPFVYPTTPIFVGDKEKRIREILTIATKDRLMSDRPIACLLSGGLDSSVITSIICKLIGPEKVRTYSIGMEGSMDLRYAKKVATFLGTNHTEVLFTAEEGFAVIPQIIRDIESYDITTIRASVGMWLLARYISQNTQDIVLFSGEGADELFCGYLYFHYAPTPSELHQESVRLLQELYLYDVLRADRCISSHGLELRVPFLDRRLIDICLSLSGEDKMPKNGMEKHILRQAFSDNYLPEDILWRRKDGMSDGISGNKGKKWYEQIQEFVEAKISDKEFESQKHSPLRAFPTKEAYYYRKIYDEIFPTYQPQYNFWLPKWVQHKGDPSGRNLNIFEG